MVMIGVENWGKTWNSSNRVDMKRASEVKNDGNSGSECGERLRVKKIRVSATDVEKNRALQEEEVGVDIEYRDNDGSRDQVMGVKGMEEIREGSRVVDLIHEKESDSEEVVGGIENRTMGVQELGYVVEQHMISSGSEACHTKDTDREVGAKENMVSGLEEEGIKGEIKETEGRDLNFEKLGIPSEEGVLLNGGEGCGNRDTEDKGNKKSDHVREMVEVIEISDDAEKEEILDLDLNVPVVEAGDFGNGMGCQECKQLGPMTSERRVEIIEITSDESEDEGDRSSNVGDARAKGKEVVIELAYESTGGSDLDLRLMENGPVADGSSSLGCGRRYTREEKGKAKLADSWLSLASDPMQLDLEPESKEVIELDIATCLVQLRQTSLPAETMQLLESENLEFRIEKAVMSLTVAPILRQEADRVRHHVPPLRKEADRVRHREILSYAPGLARFNPEGKDSHEESKQEREGPPLEADIESENLHSPFATMLKMLREQNLRRRGQQLIQWKPSENHGFNTSNPHVPSLLDLSLKVLAKNAECIVSLEPVPDALKRRLSDLLCDNRGMTGHVLDLLVRRAPTEIRVKDCSWLTEEQFINIFRSVEVKNLR
ncbi:unnamed protein product, partial [Ilex paraguariensis]